MQTAELRDGGLLGGQSLFQSLRDWLVHPFLLYSPKTCDSFPLNISVNIENMLDAVFSWDRLPSAIDPNSLTHIIPSHSFSDFSTEHLRFQVHV